jgi:WD40 repeat protein
MGTPSYMPPEQARGERADQQSDVYAIGAILYHVLVGRPPHVGRDLETLLDQVRTATPAKLPAAVPRDLVAIVELAIARDRAMRYPSAAELASDLRRFMTGQLVRAHHYTRRQRLARFVSRNRGALAVAGVALAIVGAVATFAIRDIVRARGEATASRDDARDGLVASYVDRAGLELVNGQPARSLAYTIASAQVAALTPQTRLMAAYALDQLPAVRWWNDVTPQVARFLPASHDLLLNENDEIVRWNPDADRVQWRLQKGSGADGLGGDVRLVGGNMLAAFRDSSVALVGLADGALIADIKGSAGAPYTAMGADDGGRWVGARAADRIDLFDTATRALVASIPFAKALRAPTIAADGEHILVAATRSAMSVLDRSGNVVATLRADDNVVTAGDELVYASPPGDDGIVHLVVGDYSGHVRLDLPIGSSLLHALAVDVAAKRIALGAEDGVVQIRSLVSGAVVWQTSLGDRVAAVVFDGNMLRAASSSAAVGFDVTSGLELERAAIAGTLLVAASDDHARVAASVLGVGFAVWARAQREHTLITPAAGQVADLAFARDGAVISAGDDGELDEVRDGRTVRVLGSGGAISTITRLDDGTVIAASPDGTIVVRDRDGRELRRFASGIAATPSPDGRQIAAATADSTVAIWDVATGMRVRALGKLVVKSIRWSPDGRRIAAVTPLGEIFVWDVNGGVLRHIARGQFFKGNIAFSNDSTWLVRAGEPADTLFALDGGSDRTLLEAPKSVALVVAFSPDDKTVLVAGMGFLSTWDIATTATRLRIAVGGTITSAAFLDHGSYIIAGGVDRRVHVWNAKSGAELLAFTMPAPTRKIVVERSGTRVAILAGRGAIVWSVPAFPGTLDDLRERARCRLDVDVIDAHLRAHSIDIAGCNRVALSAGSASDRP